MLFLTIFNLKAMQDLNHYIYIFLKIYLCIPTVISFHVQIFLKYMPKRGGYHTTLKDFKSKVLCKLDAYFGCPRYGVRLKRNFLYSTCKLTYCL